MEQSFEIIAYARSATIKQSYEDNSPISQLMIISDWAESKGYHIAKMYAENGKSGSNVTDLFNNIVNDIILSPNRNIGIAVTERCRVSRNFTESADIFRRLKNKKISFYPVLSIDRERLSLKNINMLGSYS